MSRTLPTFRAGALTAALFAISAAVSACSIGGDERGHGGQAQQAEGDVGAWSPASLSEVDGVPVATLRSAIQQRLDGKRPQEIEDEAWEHTKRLYKRFQGTPLWFDKSGVDNDRAEALTNAVLNASDDGLRMDVYPVAELAQTLSVIRQAKRPTAEQIADADVLLTAAYASIGEDFLTGQVDPRKVSQSWHIEANDENVDSALVRTLTKEPLDKAIAAMRPTGEDYAGLQKQLERYRGIVSKGGWKPVPEGKALKRGDADTPARLAALRARLAAEGIEVPAASSADAANPAPAGGTSATPARRTQSAGATFDAGLAAALAHFQALHAIAVDSQLGKETLDALNVPAEYRLGQIAANLERMRWMPRSLGQQYIYVNVPAFHLTAYDKGEPALDMKVIVGQEYEDKSTPVFADSMETVVFRPYWNVTPDIQAKEIEPKLASNPGYLAANDMEYFNDGGQQRIRQRPGPKNSLGLVKFLFPNDFNIYLHDTPNRELFDKDVRAFSHGCIRVEKPAELAQWVLGWDAARVDAAMHDGKDNQSVKLPHKIPVYITYATTFIRDGELHFGNDLSHRDDELVKAIATGAVPSSATVKAVEQLKAIAKKA
jgi:murein L,D-transpeptidase YcbB/YkuD